MDFIIFIYNNYDILSMEQRILYIEVYNDLKWSVFAYICN